MKMPGGPKGKQQINAGVKTPSLKEGKDHG